MTSSIVQAIAFSIISLNFSVLVFIFARPWLLEAFRRPSRHEAVILQFARPERHGGRRV